MFLICIIAFLFIFSLLIYKLTILKRLDHPVKIYEKLKKEDNDFLRSFITLKNTEGNDISGYFYYYKNLNYKGLIINVHGLANDNETQLGRMIEFAKEGYVIFFL